MQNYLSYPTKVMTITQSYLGAFSHAENYTGTPNDYPIDEACEDNARSYFYCPCDEIKVVRMYGVNGAGTNTIWLQSTSKVVAPTFTDYVTIMVIHPNDDTLKGMYVGKTYKRNEPIFLEGDDGYATGFHFHISVARGKYMAPGWVRNSKGAWVLTGNTVKPDHAFYIQPSFTKIRTSAGLRFKTIPTTETFTVGNYVCNYVMRVRIGAGLKFRQKGKSELTKDGQRNANQYGCYKKGTIFTALEIIDDGEQGLWARTPSGYVCLKDKTTIYCKKL